MKFIGLAFLLAMAAIASAVTNVTSCQTLNVTGETYNVMNPLSMNGSTCFNVVAPNVLLNVSGFSVTGNNVYGQYGVYSDQINTTIKNGVFNAFDTGIYFNGAVNGSIINSTGNSTTAVYGTGILLAAGSNGNQIINSTGESWDFNSGGIQIDGSSNNRILSSVAIGHGSRAIFLFASSNNTIANSTLYTGSYLYNSHNNSITNNTIIAPTGDGYASSGGSSKNAFSLNNFTGVVFTYVRDDDGLNYYNSTVYGINQGNIWGNVIDGTVNITGTQGSTIPSLYVGTEGVGYPYNSTSSLGKVSSNVVDYAPLTKSGSTQSNLPVQQASIAKNNQNVSWNLSVEVIGNGTCFYTVPKKGVVNNSVITNSTGGAVSNSGTFTDLQWLCQNTSSPYYITFSTLPFIEEIENVNYHLPGQNQKRILVYSQFAQTTAYQINYTPAETINLALFLCSYSENSSCDGISPYFTVPFNLTGSELLSTATLESNETVYVVTYDNPPVPGGGGGIAAPTNQTHIPLGQLPSSPTIKQSASSLDRILRDKSGGIPNVGIVLAALAYFIGWSVNNKARQSSLMGVATLGSLFLFAVLLYTYQGVLFA